MFIAGKRMDPVPLADSTKSSLVLLADMLLPETVMSPENNGDAYNSANIVFTFSIADLNVSPVPSLAFPPTFKFILAIFIP
jgi:hypothetical protein